METMPLQIPNTYVASGTIPQKLMKGPVMIYWIHTINEDARVTDSDKYVIGIKPDYPLKGILEMDTLQNVDGSSTFKPKIYFTNKAEGPVYGTISLEVDGKTVYAFPADLYDVEQSEVTLEWNVPKTEELTRYTVLAHARFYDQALETKEVKINTFPPTQIMSLSELNTIRLIQDKVGNMVAHLAILYSSFRDDGNLRYHVVSPDGICVIGSSAKCHVRDPTSGQRRHAVSVTIMDQIYRVEYSGPDAALERFTITSTDPISGRWDVKIETSSGMIQRDIMKDVSLKIKYLPEKCSLYCHFQNDLNFF